ncbi:MAG: hypothetical protein IKV15_04760 [Bacteroidaceae bacterium]|nr:hypothetical protein [Bacteroidaceae bacterium]
MGKRNEDLSPLGELVANEVEKCGLTVKSLCAIAHIGGTTYYKLLFGKTL